MTVLNDAFGFKLLEELVFGGLAFFLFRPRRDFKSLGRLPKVAFATKGLDVEFDVDGQVTAWNSQGRGPYVFGNPEG